MAILKSGDLWYYRSPAAFASIVAYPSPVKINLASFNNLNGTIKQYIMLFDLPKIPAEGSLPLIELITAPDGMASYVPAFGGRVFHKGLIIAVSVTPVILTTQTVPTLGITCQIEGRIG